MIKKIHISELKNGMYVCGLERDESGNILRFMNNILIKDEEEIQRFVNGGYKFVYVETEEGKAPFSAFNLKDCDEGQVPEKEEAPAGPGPAAGEDAKQTAAEAAPGKTDAPLIPEKRPIEAFYEELKEAQNIRNQAESLVRDFMSAVRDGGEIKSDAVHETVGKMVDSIFRNQDALTSLARLKSFDDYTFAHSVNVCILSVTLGRHMGLSKEELQDLGVGAILHDVGKMLVPEEILKKPARLTDDEFRKMKDHTGLGADLLARTKDISDTSRLVALEHHEKYDGTGYLRSLAGTQIHSFARIAAVADVYDAMTSNRVYQRGIPPEEAMKKMYFLRETHFEPQLVERLIRCLGIYPIGTVVELNTGETAVVTMPNHNYPLQPLVLMVADKERKRYDRPFEVNLHEGTDRWITRSLNPSVSKDQKGICVA